MCQHRLLLLLHQSITYLTYVACSSCMFDPWCASLSMPVAAVLSSHSPCSTTFVLLLPLPACIVCAGIKMYFAHELGHNLVRHDHELCFGGLILSWSMLKIEQDGKHNPSGLYTVLVLKLHAGIQISISNTKPSAAAWSLVFWLSCMTRMTLFCCACCETAAQQPVT